MRRLVALAGILAAAGVGVAALVASGSSSDPHRLTGPSPRLVTAAATAGTASGRIATVGLTPVTRPLPAGFLGLALEYNTIPRWVGPSGEPVDPVLVRLIDNLDPAGDPVLRIGGQSTDRAWWPVAHMARPRGVTYNLTPAWAQAARRLAQALDARYLLGINLEANRTRISQTEADQLVRRIGRSFIAALNIGNEPDLYTVTPWYREADGHPLAWYAHTGTPVFSRPRGYGPDQFIDEVRRTLRVMPDLPIGGPDTVTAAWISNYARLMTRHSRVRMIDAHAYPLINCVTDPSAPKYPSVAHLLALSSSRDLLAGTGPFIAQARRDGGQFRVDEMGSVSCNGRAGVSNTMASALWAADALFAADRAGVDGVNLHTYPDSVNGLFDLAESDGHWTARIHPLYDGAVLFAQAAPTGSRLLPVAGGDQRQLRTWATLAPDHRVRVLLINVGAATDATVRAPAGYGSAPATVERLQAPSAAATHDLTLGGESFASTDTGALPTKALPVVAPTAGAYRIAIPAASAALITLAPRSSAS